MNVWEIRVSVCVLESDRDRATPDKWVQDVRDTGAGGSGDPDTCHFQPVLASESWEIFTCILICNCMMRKICVAGCETVKWFEYFTHRRTQNHLLKVFFVLNVLILFTYTSMHLSMKNCNLQSNTNDAPELQAIRSAIAAKLACHILLLLWFTPWSWWSSLGLSPANVSAEVSPAASLPLGSAESWGQG